jgi:hypothetical protein
MAVLFCSVGVGDVFPNSSCRRVVVQYDETSCAKERDYLHNLKYKPNSKKLVSKFKSYECYCASANMQA